MVGDLYVADFGETGVEDHDGGRAARLRDGLYGSSGKRDRSRRASAAGEFLRRLAHKIDRKGEAKTFAIGLYGPVGVAVDRKSGDIMLPCVAATP
jgi:hypothetical protein